MLRFSLAVALALPTTALLFLFLHVLISRRADPGEIQQVHKIEFSRLRPELDPVEPRLYPKPEREPPPEKPPPVGIVTEQNLNPDQTMAELIANVNPGIDLRGATVLGGGGGGGGGAGGNHDGSGERDALPLVRVDPDYPPRAMQQGLEGWVLVEFTISPAGTIKNPRVIDAQPPSVFDESALTAIRRWRYNPRLENGVAVAREGVQVRLRFDLGRSRR